MSALHSNRFDNPSISSNFIHSYLLLSCDLWCSTSCTAVFSKRTGSSSIVTGAHLWLRNSLSHLLVLFAVFRSLASFSSSSVSRRPFSPGRLPNFCKILIEIFSCPNIYIVVHARKFPSFVSSNRRFMYHLLPPTTLSSTETFRPLVSCLSYDRNFCQRIRHYLHITISCSPDLCVRRSD
jgi:hypothetical protein